MNDLFGSEFKLDPSITDIEARVMTYFHLANEIIKRNSVSDLFAGADGIKRKCKVLVKFLPDPLMKSENELEYRSGEIKANMRGLYRIVSNLALELDKETRAVKQIKMKTPKPAKMFSTRGPMKISGRKPGTVVNAAPKPKQQQGELR
ncbi:hypothetical protein PF002_g23 [Phytophthora fragariae]|uniref:Uncharacterized protein n=2 Tax=Phytophthora fragariae TaxID=53985 RepID=A0A6A4APE8_9STRA|nr:hypothetical protein PF007_g284 [Phytophthora fragariae]KAE9258520.1 hypothetical protein PF002_g23 [Phytophthora fragariae]